MVEKVVVGGYDEDGNIDPAQLVFVYKTGFKNSLDGNRFKPERKNARANRKPKNLYSHTNDENQSLCSDTKADTRWRMKHRSKFDNKDWRSESLIMSADLIPLERQRN